MIDENDDPMQLPRRGEDLGVFQLRMSLLRRTRGVLEKLARAGFSISIEGDEEAETPDADYIIQYGDLRVRLIVIPNIEDPSANKSLPQEARLQLLQHADADAVVFVGAAETLPACIFDLYETYADERGSVEVQGEQLERVLSEFFTANLVAVELPDFQNLVDLPDRLELRDLLESCVRGEFRKLRAQRAIIPEKRAALESVSDADLSRVTSAITEALESKSPRGLVSRVVGEEGDD